MSTLLRIDSSINGDNSHSRKVTASFADEWRKHNPDGTVVYRDLAADPVPHIDALTYYAALTPEDEHSAEQAEAWLPRKRLVEELAEADVVLIGAPMYNFSIPSHLKAWIDYIGVPRFFADADTGRSELSDKKFIVATARGGSYAPGTPRESFEHQEPYLRSLLSFLGADKDLTFVHTEMTMSLVMPHLAQFKDVFEQTSAEARRRVRELAAA